MLRIIMNVPVVIFLVKNVKNIYEYFSCYTLFCSNCATRCRKSKPKVFLSSIFCLAHQCNNCIYLSKDKNGLVILKAQRILD